MRLFYTGSESALGTQTNPFKSLGGYISISPVESFSDGGVFPSIGQTEMLNGSSEVRLLALKNETEDTQSITLYYENQPDSLVYYRMGLVSPATDDCDRQYFEKISSGSALPTSVVFRDNRSVVDALTFNINASDYIGIWIQRVVLSSKGTDYLSCENLLDRDNLEETDSTVEWTLDSIVDGSYFTIGKIAVIIDSGLAAQTAPDGYEDLRVPYLITDTISEVDQKIKDKISQILVDRGEVTQSDNIISMSGMQQTPINSNNFTINFTQASSNSVEENMSIIMDY